MIKTKASVTYNRDKIYIEPDAEATSPSIGVRKKFAKLDAIRGFAALYVMCYHTLDVKIPIGSKVFNPFMFAPEAVILFFILSGFVIQYAYATSSDKSFQSFFLKRFLRIYIPLLCVFVANYSLQCINEHHLITIDWMSLIGNLLMIQQVGEMWSHNVLFSPFMQNLPLWSLTFEWWFYMIFFFMFNKFGDKASPIVYTVGILAAISYTIYPFIINREFMYLAIWWMGADIAKLYIHKKDITLRNLRLPLLSLCVITFILVCKIITTKIYEPKNVLHFSFTPYLEVRHLGFGILALPIAIYWRKINWAGFKYTLGLFQPLASISFTLYISHWFLVSNAEYLNAFISNTYVRDLVYFIICCAFCYCIERILYPFVSKRILTYYHIKKKPFVVVS